MKSTEEMNCITGEIVDTAIQIHTRLGPGLLESVYSAILAHELRKSGLHVEREVGVPVVWDQIRFDIGFVADQIVDDCISLELKSIQELAAVHKKQLLTYLRLADKRLGYLIHFGAELIKDGISRVSNGAADWKTG